LTSVFELSKVLTPENRDEVLPRFFLLSRREAKSVVAALRPDEAPARREVVTAIRVAGTSPATGRNTPAAVLSTASSSRVVACASQAPEAAAPAELDFTQGGLTGSEPDTSVTVRPETWVTLRAHALGTDQHRE
jgi:hypothetical protein